MVPWYTMSESVRLVQQSYLCKTVACANLQMLLKVPLIHGNSLIFNLCLVKGIQLTGINTTKLMEFMRAKMGIKIAADHNIRNRITKVQKSVRATYKERVLENRQEHVKVVRESSDYCGDVLWESNGKQNLTGAGGLCIDGAGCTRIYNNRHRRCQSAAVANSTVTKKSLALVVSQVRLLCVMYHSNCIRTLNA